MPTSKNISFSPLLHIFTVGLQEQPAFFAFTCPKHLDASIGYDSFLTEYNLKLHFDDGSIKLVNLENMLKNAKNMFLPLLDVNYFKKVKCDGTTICWPNGLDLCPDCWLEWLSGA